MAADDEPDNCRASRSGDCLNLSYGYTLCLVGQCRIGEWNEGNPVGGGVPNLKRAERKPVRGRLPEDPP